MKAAVSITVILVLLATARSAGAQAAVTTLALSPDRIGEIRTAQGITTRIVFNEPVQDIICGDLYDPGSGKGSFVAQRGGTGEHPGNDVFVKPVASKGMSNMFVKTGDGKHTYSFDLSIVPPGQAHRMVSITDAAPAPTPKAAAPSNADPEKPAPDFERLKAEAEQQARQRAAEILRGAQQQADRKIAEADAKMAEAERQAPQRAAQEIERRFTQALMLGLRETKVNSTRATVKKVVITLDSRILVFDEKAYLRYTIQNAGDKDFAFTAISLEVTEAKESKPVTAEIIQSKAANLLPPGESLTGIIAFDPKQVGTKQKLMLFVRGEDSAELAHVTIQE